MDEIRHAQLVERAAETRANAEFWRATCAAEPFQEHLATLNKRLDGERADLEHCEPKELIRIQARIQAFRAVLGEFRTIADSAATDARNAGAALAEFEAENGLFLAAARAETGAGNVVAAAARVERAMAPDPDVLYEDAGNGIPTEPPSERPKRKARASA